MRFQNPTVILHGRKTARTDRVIQFRSSTFPVKNIYHNRRQWKVCKTAWFMGDDFVYGVADAADVSTEAAGNVIFPDVSD